MSVGLILTVGQNPNQLESLNLLLSAAGHIVESSYSIIPAVHQFLCGDFDVIVLCPSLSLEDQTRFTSAIRASGSYITILRMPQSLPLSSAPANPLLYKGLLSQVDFALAQSAIRQRTAGAFAPKLASDKSLLARPAVLVWTHALDFASTQRLEFERAGFLVLTVKESWQLLEVFSTGIADAVLIDSAHGSIGNLMVNKLRELNSAVPLVVRGKAPVGLSTELSGSVIESSLFPEETAAEVRQMLRRNGVPAIRTPRQHRAVSRLGRKSVASHRLDDSNGQILSLAPKH